MHRVLNEEIIRLSHFTGDDLWNLVAKVNDSEDLIEVISKKHVSFQSYLVVHIIFFPSFITEKSTVFETSFRTAHARNL
jgi:hypothetical protein